MYQTKLLRQQKLRSNGSGNNQVILSNRFYPIYIDETEKAENILLERFTR